MNTKINELIIKCFSVALLHLWHLSFERRERCARCIILRKYMLATQTKTIWKNKNKKKQKNQTARSHNVYFFWFIFFISLFFLFFLCCQHKFKIILYLVSKFKFPNISLKNIPRKSHNITKNHHRIREKNTQISKRAYISPQHSPPLENTAFSPFRFVLWPRHEN